MENKHILFDNLHHDEPKWSTIRSQKTHNISLNFSKRTNFSRATRYLCITKLMNQCHRLRYQLKRESTFDPYCLITLHPLSKTFITLPIYGGGNHVAFTEFDDNQAKFDIDSKTLIDNNCILNIQVFDSDISTHDKYIGETEIFLKSGENGFVLDADLFTTISIKSKTNEFSGKIELSALWTNDALTVNVLTATHLKTSQEEHRRIHQDPMLIIRCLTVFALFFIIAVIIFCFVEEWSLPITIWFLIVTTTTVGYGDVTPKTDAGKLFNCVYLLISTILLGWAFSIVLNYIITMHMNQNKIKENSTNVTIQRNIKWYKSGFFINFWLVIVWIVISVLFYTFVSNEGWSWIDSLQFSLVTITMVGYGDVAPESLAGRIFAVVFMVSGILLLARFARNIMDYILTQRRTSMVNKIMNNSLIIEEQIDEFDADGTGQIDKFEYLSRMLILTNEVDTKVINKIMNKFNEIDVDRDGFITCEDFDRSVSVAKTVESVTVSVF